MALQRFSGSSLGHIEIIIKRQRLLHRFQKLWTGMHIITSVCKERKIPVMLSHCL